MLRYTLYAILLFVVALGSSYLYLRSVTYYSGPQSDHFNGVRFFNPYDGHLKRSVYNFVKWQSMRAPEVWPKHVDVERFDIPPKAVDDAIRVSYVGHSTVLIQVDGLNILTDPMWSMRAGPMPLFGVRRVIEPGIKFKDLPHIDLVLISHNHYDHMDKKTIKALIAHSNPKFVTLLGNDALLHSFDSSINVVALDWFESHEFESVTVNAVPALHWSGRFIVDRNKALWGGFVVESNHGNIYFAGDTGFGSGKIYDLIRDKFKDIKLAFLPIGGYEPRWFMQYRHNDPQDTVNAFIKLGSEFGVPIHYGVFQLSDEAYHRPLEEFTKALGEQQVSEANFKSLKVGEAWTIN